jgi:hypothetical protein
MTEKTKNPRKAGRKPYFGSEKTTVIKISKKTLNDLKKVMLENDIYVYDAGIVFLTELYSNLKENKFKELRKWQKEKGK